MSDTTDSIDGWIYAKDELIDIIENLYDNNEILGETYDSLNEYIRHDADYEQCRDCLDDYYCLDLEDWIDLWA